MIQQTVQQHDLLNNLQTIRARMGLKRAVFSIMVQKNGYRVVRAEPPAAEIDSAFVNEEQWELIQGSEDRSIG